MSFINTAKLRIARDSTSALTRACRAVGCQQSRFRSFANDHFWPIADLQ